MPAFQCKRLSTLALCKEAAVLGDNYEAILELMHSRNSGCGVHIWRKRKQATPSHETATRNVEPSECPSRSHPKRDAAIDTINEMLRRRNATLDAEFDGVCDLLAELR